MKNKFAIFLVLSLLPAVPAHSQKSMPVKFDVERYVFRNEPEYAADSTRLIEILSYRDAIKINPDSTRITRSISMYCDKLATYYYRTYGDSDSTGNKIEFLKDRDYLLTVTSNDYDPDEQSEPPVGYFLLGNVRVFIFHWLIPAFLRREGTAMTINYTEPFSDIIVEVIGLPQWTILCRGGKLALICYLEDEDADGKWSRSQRNIDNIGEAYVE